MERLIPYQERADAARAAADEGRAERLRSLALLLEPSCPGLAFEDRLALAISLAAGVESTAPYVLIA